MYLYVKLNWDANRIPLRMSTDICRLRGAQFVPMGMLIICWNPPPPHRRPRKFCQLETRASWWCLLECTCSSNQRVALQIRVPSDLKLNICISDFRFCEYLYLRFPFLWIREICFVVDEGYPVKKMEENCIIYKAHGAVLFYFFGLMTSINLKKTFCWFLILFLRFLSFILTLTLALLTKLPLTLLSAHFRARWCGNPLKIFNRWKWALYISIKLVLGHHVSVCLILTLTIHYPWQTIRNKLAWILYCWMRFKWYWVQWHLDC